jgi:high-affinity K+ transport system ATPase subunit B
MAAEPQAQTSIYETTLDNPAVEELLEKREKARLRKGEANKAYKQVDGAAKTALEGLDLGEDAPVRIGRFVVVVKAVPAKSVTFETDPTSRLQIGLLKTAE